jgi:hypothetical protein
MLGIAVAAGLLSVAGLSQIGADVRKREEEKRRLENASNDSVETGVESMSLNERGGPTDEATGEDEEEKQVLFDMDVLEKSSPTQEWKKSLQTYESEPTLCFEDGEKGSIETAGCETALLIAAATLAATDSTVSSYAWDSQLPPAPPISPSSTEDVMNEGNEKIQQEMKTLLKKASISVLSSSKKSPSMPSPTENPDEEEEETSLISTTSSTAATDWTPWLTLGLAGAA